MGVTEEVAAPAGTQRAEAVAVGRYLSPSEIAYLAHSQVADAARAVGAPARSWYDLSEPEQRDAETRVGAVLRGRDAGAPPSIAPEHAMLWVLCVRGLCTVYAKAAG